MLATEIMLRSSEEWSLRRYLTMDRLVEIRETQNPLLRDVDNAPYTFVCPPIVEIEEDSWRLTSLVG
jgi:hypothetical protein